MKHSRAAYIRAIEALEETMKIFLDQFSALHINLTSNFRNTHVGLSSGLDFYKRELYGIEVYVNTTLRRLEIQRGLTMILIAQRDSKLNYEIAVASKYDSSVMKTLSILGILFLPGTLIASIFSMSFFDFHDASTLAAAVSPHFWIYWAITVPITLISICIFLMWERNRSKMYNEEKHVRKQRQGTLVQH